jgi:uncharacterized protein (DUF58 family)
MTRDLLTPEFVRELEAMRRLLGPRARSGQMGSRTAKRLGRGPEFHEHRAYANGDDVRRLDWLVFARTGQPMLKEHRADEDVIVRILLDTSASLGFGTPRKMEIAKRIAGGVAYLALAASERAQVVVTPNAENAPRTPPLRGRAALASVLRTISESEATGTANLSRAITEVSARANRPGFLVVVSDFFDAGPVVEALRRARFAGHDVALVQVFSPEDKTPDLTGDLTIVDSETGATVDITADHAAIAAYLRQLDALSGALRTFARTTRSSYVQALTTEPLSETLRKIVASAVD